MFKPHHFILIFSTVFFYLCSFGYFRLFYLHGGNTISWRATVHFLKTPHSLMSHWWFVIIHGGSLYTMETGKCSKSGLFFSKRQVRL